MSTHLSTKIPVCRNAMESLAIAKIDQQIKKLPPEMVKSINKADAIAYSLNRLPPMYFTTIQGGIWQEQRAQKILEMIYRVINLSIKASQRNTKMFSTPLHPSFCKETKIITHLKPMFDESNAMTPLVTEEVELQLKKLPDDILKSINTIDVIAYTLNRVPPLYSTTKEGWEWQQKLAKENLIDMISRVTYLGIKAAQRKSRMIVAS
ncbi:MAG: late competence development ComFB family protein [Microcoleaceae cyanobacterium MO_207.B10]|nr:late competence development ComFB family protein [Microcoleaceae cyanobacterium MO_207.B10]